MTLNSFLETSAVKVVFYPVEGITCAGAPGMSRLSLILDFLVTSQPQAGGSSLSTLWGKIPVGTKSSFEMSC